MKCSRILAFFIVLVLTFSTFSQVTLFTEASSDFFLNENFLSTSTNWLNVSWGTSSYNNGYLTSSTAYLGYVGAPSAIYNKELGFQAKFTGSTHAFIIAVRQTPGMVALTDSSASAYAIVYDQWGFHLNKYINGVLTSLGAGDVTDNMMGTFIFDQYYNFKVAAIDEGNNVRIRTYVNGIKVVDVLDNSSPIKAPTTSYMSFQGPAIPTLSANTECDFTDVLLRSTNNWLNTSWGTSSYSNGCLTSSTAYLGYVGAPSTIYNKKLNFTAKFTGTTHAFIIAVRQTPGMMALSDSRLSAYAIIYDQWGFYVSKFVNGMPTVLGAGNVTDNMMGTFQFGKNYKFNISAIDEASGVRISVYVDGLKVVDVLDSSNPIKAPESSYMTFQGPAIPTISSNLANNDYYFADDFLESTNNWMNIPWATSTYNDGCLSSSTGYLGYIGNPTLIYNKELGFKAKFTGSTSFLISLRQTPGMIALSDPSVSAYAIAYDLAGFHVKKYRNGVLTDLGKGYVVNNMMGSFVFGKYYNFNVSAIDEGDSVRITAIIDGIKVVDVLDSSNPINSTPATSYFSIQGPAIPTISSNKDVYFEDGFLNASSNWANISWASSSYSNGCLTSSNSYLGYIGNPSTIYNKNLLFRAKFSNSTAFTMTIRQTPGMVSLSDPSASAYVIVYDQWGFYLKKVLNGIATVLGAGDVTDNMVGTFVFNQYYDFKVAAINEENDVRITVYVDGLKVIDVLDSVNPINAPTTGILTFQGPAVPTIQRILSNDSTLASIGLSAASFNGSFDMLSCGVQVINVDSGLKSCKIMPVASNCNSIIKAYWGTSSETGIEIIDFPTNGSLWVAFNQGDMNKHVTFKVTAADQSSTHEYVFYIKGVEENGYIKQAGRLNGLGEYLSMVKNYTGANSAANVATLAGALGGQSFRLWMLAGDFMSTPDTMYTSGVDEFKKWISKLKAGGIKQIIGMNNTWFLPAGINNTDLGPVPDRNTTPNSTYMQWLAMYQTMWCNISKTFPEILYWEIGNESNHDPFLHPLDYYPNMTHTFTLAEKAAITTDMLYYGSLGVHQGNPDALTLTPGLAPVNGIADMANFLSLVYQNINSGNFGGGSTNSDDYFQCLAWHPYWNGAINQTWVNENNAVYQVAINNGDNGKKVFFTEFGYDDGGNSTTDSTQANWMVDAFNFITTQMPYVESMHTYVMTNDSATFYGLFANNANGHFTPKAKANSIKNLFGGVGNISQFAP